MGPAVSWMWPKLSGAIGGAQRNQPELSARGEGRYTNFTNFTN